MRVAVDASALAHPASDLGRYTESLLRRLVTAGHQWFLYADRAITLRFPVDDHVQIRMGGIRPGSPASTLYSQLVFPRWARGDCVDLFWSPRQQLPPRLPDSTAGVVTIHDLGRKSWPQYRPEKQRWLQQWLLRRSLQRAGKIIVVSEFARGEIARFFPACEQRSVVIHGAVDCWQQLYEQSPPTPAQHYLLVAGTAAVRYDLQRLLQAYSQALATRSLGQDLVLAGLDVRAYPDFSATIEALGLAGRVHVMGRVSAAELASLYRGATALLVPSRYQASGLPALEAMSHGVPVVASDRGALAEIIADGGLLVDPDSTEALAQAILLVCSDPAQRQLLAVAATRRAQQFNWEEVAQQTLAVFEQAIADKRRAGVE
jgi:glycosyltransferase involved in cell wall biosynthesis